MGTEILNNQGLSEHRKSAMVSSLNGKFYRELMNQEDPQLIYRDFCMHGKSYSLICKMFETRANIEMPFKLLFWDPIRLAEVLTDEYGRRVVSEYNSCLLY